MMADSRQLALLDANLASDRVAYFTFAYHAQHNYPTQ